MLPASRIARTIAAGQRADVGAPVAADLRLVADAAEGDPDELPAHGAGHGLAERGLADPGRPRQRQDGAATAPADDAEPLVGAALAHGQVLDDAVLDVVEAGVVGVEHRPRARRCRRSPRSARSRGCRGRCPARCGSSRSRATGRRSAPACRPPQRGLPDLLGQVGRLDAGAVVVLLGGRPRRSARPAPCGPRRAAGAAGTRAAASPCPPGRPCGSSRRRPARPGDRGPTRPAWPAARPGRRFSSSSTFCAVLSHGA